MELHNTNTPRLTLKPYLEGERDWKHLFRVNVVMTPLTWDPADNFQKIITVPLSNGNTSVSRASLRRRFEPESDPAADLEVYRTKEENVNRPYEERVRLWKAAHLNFKHDTIFMLKNFNIWMLERELDTLLLAARHGLTKFVGSASDLGVTVMLTPQLYGRWNAVRKYCRREWNHQKQQERLGSTYYSHASS